MFLDFTKPGVFHVGMSHYVHKILKEFPDEITKISATPHPDALFTVKDEESVMWLLDNQAIVPSNSGTATLPVN